MLIAAFRGWGKGSPRRIRSRIGRYSLLSMYSRSSASSWGVKRQLSFRYSRKDSHEAGDSISVSMSISSHPKRKTEGKSLNPNLTASVKFGYQTVHWPVTCKTMFAGRAGSAAGAMRFPLFFAIFNCAYLQRRDLRIRSTT